MKDVALLRGAARLQQKDWGAIVTWVCTKPTYLDSGEAVYDQMVSIHEAGARYIVVFNYSYSGRALRHHV